MQQSRGNKSRQAGGVVELSQKKRISKPISDDFKTVGDAGTDADASCEFQTNASSTTVTATTRNDTTMKGGNKPCAVLSHVD